MQRSAGGAQAQDGHMQLLQELQSPSRTAAPAPRACHGGPGPAVELRLGVV